MCKKYIYFIGLFLIIICFVKNTAAYNDKITHPDITKKAAENSQLDQYLKNNLGLQNGIATKFSFNNELKTITKWLREGAELEDDPICRASNHFHDPLKLWSESGMSDEPGWLDMYCYFWSPWYSNITWATGYEEQGGAIVDRNKQEMGWEHARAYYHSALTSTSETDRETYYVNFFQSLGHVMHLLEDMAVPAHTRNDFASHLKFNEVADINPTKWLGNRFEYFVKIRPALVDATPVSPSFTTPLLTDFWDIDQYDGSNPSAGTAIGLAEYSNANFLSGTTIFKGIEDPTHSYPYPDWSSIVEYDEVIDDVTGKVRTYLRKTGDGETIEHLAAGKWFYKYLPSSLKDLGLMLDDSVYLDYADKLLPRAVGYSAGLLDYFFRGKINIVQTGADAFQIVNLSDEDMEGNLASFKLYYDDINDERIEIPLAFYDELGSRYTDPNTVLSIPAQTKSLFKAELQSVPVDPQAPGEYMLVYKGRLGSEGAAPYDTDYAVAAQKITPHFLTYAEVNSEWDVYEYDLLGNRIYSLTGGLTRGIPYYNGIPNPVNPDELFYLSYSGCTEGYSCLHLLTKSTEQSEDLSKFGTFWWSNDGTRIYAFHGGYYDISTSTWMTSPWIITDACLYSGFGYPPSFSNDETKIVVEALDPYGTEYDYDILIYTNSVLTHIVDMNTTGSLVSLNDPTDCAAYGGDENFMDAAPDYHPTEDRILFTSNADGGTPEKITGEGLKHYFPRWIRYLGQ